MKKLIEFGRKAVFYVRVLSGYEQYRIRSYGIQLQKRWQQAEARQAAMRKLPEQIILSEVRRMVTEMQSLNKKLDETEVAIQKYFSKIDKNAEMIMETQLQEKEKNMKQMFKLIQTQALLENAEVEQNSNMDNAHSSINDIASSGRTSTVSRSNHLR